MDGLKNQRVLVTGSAGSIGSELVRQLSVENDVCGIDLNETELFDLHEDLRWKERSIKSILGDVRIGEVFKRVKDVFGIPTHIFHCAALKHVTPSAWWPEEYVRTNILGTLNAIRAAKAFKAKLINISTDKVVDSESMMGATKRVAELAIRDAGYVSVRFGNVMGSRGSVLEIWKRQMDNGEPLTITDKKMKRYMMTISEAVGLVIEASTFALPGDVVILDMGKEVSILELAEKILKEKRSEVGLKVIGKRTGEKMREMLMSEDEQARALRVGNFWVISNNHGGAKTSSN